MQRRACWRARYLKLWSLLIKAIPRSTLSRRIVTRSRVKIKSMTKQGKELASSSTTWHSNMKSWDRGSKRYFNWIAKSVHSIWSKSFLTSTEPLTASMHSLRNLASMECFSCSNRIFRLSIMSWSYYNRVFLMLTSKSHSSRERNLLTSRHL